MENNKEYKYVMIVTSEDERYESGEKDLSWFGDHPWEGRLEEIVFGNSFDELFGDGEHEGLFQQTYEMETGKRLSYGFIDPDTPREEIEEWEEKRNESNANWKDIIAGIAGKLNWELTIHGNEFRFRKFLAQGTIYFEFKFESDNFDDLYEKIRRYYFDFDVSSETYKWLDEDGHGKNGAPHDMIDVYNNMRSLEDDIMKLKDDLCYASIIYNDENDVRRNKL